MIVLRVFSFDAWSGPGVKRDVHVSWGQAELEAYLRGLVCSTECGISERPGGVHGGSQIQPHKAGHVSVCRHVTSLAVPCRTEGMGTADDSVEGSSPTCDICLPVSITSPSDVPTGPEMHIEGIGPSSARIAGREPGTCNQQRNL